jgi:NAD(P)-dependent dehydrogenase (short-subunit alcohol dehydrogenase family)
MFDPASFSLKNRVALVTGSSTGLGKSMIAGLGKANPGAMVNAFELACRMGLSRRQARA